MVYKKRERLWELDFIRGLAVLGMLVFHWFYLLVFWNVAEMELFTGAWDVFGDLIRNTFFLSVGLSLVISYQRHLTTGKSRWQHAFKTLKRGGRLLFLGALATLFTLWYTPAEPIRFGVLSFIGAGVILTWPMLGRWYWLCGAAVLVLLLQAWLPWESETLLGYILGFFPSYWPSLDYFPLVPWLASIFIGAGLGHIIFIEGRRNYMVFPQPRLLEPLLWFGQKALLIYLLHLPLMMGVMYVWVSWF